MKRSTYYFLSVMLFLSASCGGPRSVSINSMRPAEITLPASVKTLLIVDRTVQNKGAVNVLEGIFTGELPGEDQSGAEELLVSLNQQLGYSARFNIKMATKKLPGNSLTRAFPEPISWEQAEELCREHGADAVVSLEIFDTDFVVTKGRKLVKENSEATESSKYYARGIGNITIGIRLYNVADRKLVDQQLLSDTHTWEASGSNLPEAILRLTSKSDATRYLSRSVGENYAYKVAPMPIRLSRSFRGKSKKSPQLEQGTRYADVAKWQEAIDVWKSGLSQARNKDAGYLAYNIAIGYEVLGDFDDALDWAETSYVRYGNKDAKDYANLIRRRIRVEQRAYDQLDLGLNEQDRE